MSLRGEIKRILNELLSNSKKITELPSGSAPSGSELIEVVQGGQNVSLTISQVASGGVGVLSVVAGTNITVDNTDPQNPIISASGGGSGLTVGTTAIASGTSTRVLYDNAGTLGEYAISGTGNVAMTTSPVFTTPNLGTPSAATLTNATGLPISTGVSGLGTGIATALGINTGSAGAPVLFDGAGGTPSSITLTNATGLPISTGLTGAGTGVLTALAVNVGTAGSFVVNGGALGTPSSGTLTNATGLPVSTGISGLAAGIATFLATPTSANLAGAVTDEIGSGSLTFNGWVIGGNTLSGAAVLGSTSAQDITMTVGNANYKLAINGTQALNVSSTHGWLFDVSGGTITANTAYDFRSRSGDTRVLRMANQANQTLWTLGSTNGEMFMGTSTNTYISPATRGSSTPTGTGLAYRASNTGGHYFLIGASNMGAFSQIDFGITAGNMVAVSSTTGQWMRSRPAFDNLTAQTSVVYTFFELSPAINVTGGSTTLRAFDFNPTETSLTSVTKYGITIGGTTWLNGFGTRTPTALIHAGAVTTAAASLRIEAGSTTTAPSSPNSGDIWHEGTGNRLMFRQGGNSVELIGTSSVNSVSPTSPNRTITVLLNNTTYYIHAKTTND